MPVAHARISGERDCVPLVRERWGDSAAVFHGLPHGTYQVEFLRAPRSTAKESLCVTVVLEASSVTAYARLAGGEVEPPEDPREWQPAPLSPAGERPAIVICPTQGFEKLADSDSSTGGFNDRLVRLLSLVDAIPRSFEVYILERSGPVGWEAELLSLGRASRETKVETAQHIRQWFDEAGKIAIDTAEEYREQLGSDFVYANITEAEVDDYRAAKSRGHYAWLDESMIAKVGDGAGAARMVGKMALMTERNYAAIQAQLGAKLQQLDTLDPSQVTDDLGLGQIVFDGTQKVFIVANLVSGTGSGSFIDVAYSVRNIMNALRTDGLLHGDFEVTGLFTLPDDITKEQLHAANTYAALEELNHFCTEGVAYHIEHPVQGQAAIRLNAATRPFDFTYLLSVQSESANQVRSHGQLEQLISEFIYGDILLPLAKERDSRRSDIRKSFMNADGKGYPTCFMSFGMSTIEYPAAQIARACTYRFLVESVNQWFNMGGGDVVEGVEPWASRTYHQQEPHGDPVAYDQLLRDLGIAAGGLREQGSLANNLLQPANVEGQDISLMERYEQLIHQAVQNYTGEPAQLQQVQSAIELGFKDEYHGSSADDDFPPGIVEQIVSENMDKFLAGFASELQARAADLIFGCQHRKEYGPHYARVFLNRVTKRIQAIAEEAKTLSATGTMAVSGEEALAELGLIRDDFMLACPFEVLRGMASQWALKRYRKAAVEYFDARLTASLQKYYAEIAETLLDHVVGLEQRLKSFSDYVETGIRLHFIARYEEQMVPAQVNGIDPLRGNIVEEITKRYDSRMGGDAEEQRRLFIRGLNSPKDPSELALELAPLDPAQSTRMDGDMTELRLDQPKEGEPRYKLPHEHEKELVDAKRKSFIEGLSEINVIYTFGQTGGDVEDDIRAVEAASRPFIQLAAADEFIRQNLGATSKRWYAYPGGGAVGQAPTAQAARGNRTHWFAEQLHRTNPTIDWNDESIDSHSGHSIVFWQERGAFPLRQVSLLSKLEEQRDAWLSASGETVSINEQNFLLSRVDVNFEPLSVEGRERVLDAEIHFFIAVATGVLNHVPAADVFEFGGSWIAGSGMTLPSDHREAKYELYRNPRAIEDIKQRIHEWRTEGMGHRDAATIQAIHAMLLNPKRLGLRIAGDQDLAEPSDEEFKRVAKLVLLGYVATDAELAKAWHDAGLEPQPLLKRTKVELRGGPDENEMDRARYPEQAFYCTECGLYRGLPIKPNGEPDEEQLEPICPRCARG